MFILSVSVSLCISQASELSNTILRCGQGLLDWRWLLPEPEMGKAQMCPVEIQYKIEEKQDTSQRADMSQPFQSLQLACITYLFVWNVEQLLIERLLPVDQEKQAHGTSQLKTAGPVYKV